MRARICETRTIFLKIIPFINGSKAYQYRAYSLAEMTTQLKWLTEKNRIMSLPLEEKRNLYKCSDFITLDSVETWTSTAKYLEKTGGTKTPNPEDVSEFQKITIVPELNNALANKVSIFKGDITKLEVGKILLKRVYSSMIFIAMFTITWDCIKPS